MHCVAFLPSVLGVRALLPERDGVRRRGGGGVSHALSPSYQPRPLPTHQPHTAGLGFRVLRLGFRL
eukprot:4977944-Pyramimonas_sp.AAC.1